jgi:hypothetical protein
MADEKAQRPQSELSRFLDSFYEKFSQNDSANSRENQDEERAHQAFLNFIHNRGNKQQQARLFFEALDSGHYHHHQST